MPTKDSLDLVELDRLERAAVEETQRGDDIYARWLLSGACSIQLRPLLDLVDRLGAVLERALTTTQKIEEALQQRHFNPGTLQKMADAVDDYRRAKGEKPCEKCSGTGDRHVAGEPTQELCGECSGEGAVSA